METSQDRIRVVVVDDHVIMREGIRALLGACGDIEIIAEAADGEEALQKAREVVSDVVIMDIAMPRMDGLEATRRMTKEKLTPKVLILSQYDANEQMLVAIRAGAVGYVPKRALGKELVAAIRAAHRGEFFLYPSLLTALVEDYRQQANRGSAGLLTVREREILKLVAKGHTSQEISDILLISPRTVQGHRAKIIKKLHVNNWTELIRYAIRSGLVSAEPRQRLYGWR